MRPTRPPSASAEQLVTEAYSKIRSAKIADPSTYRCLLQLEPSVDVFLPDVLGAAHHDQEVKILQRRYRCAFIEFDHVMIPATVSPKFTQRAGVFDRQVLER